MHLVARLMLAAILGVAVSACGGGGGNGGATTVPQTATVSDAVAHDVVLGLQPTNAVIPTVAEITGSMAFPAVSAPATVVISAAATSPDGAGIQDVRALQHGGTLTVYDYVSITPKTTVTLSSVPALSFTFPASTPMAGRTFYYGLSDPSVTAAVVSFNTQGPAQISGNTVAFAPVATPVTLKAGQRYTFVVYAAASTGAKLFVSNSGNNTVTSYDSDGSQTTPTISTGLSAPTSLAVDSSGKLYVLNTGTNSVTTYAPDGTQTTPTITTGLNGPIAVAVDGAGKIYVLNHNNFVVTTYNPDGSQTTPTISGLSQPSAIAVDAAGKVFITNLGFRTFDSGVTTYNPDGSVGQPHIASAFLGPRFIALGSTGKIYVEYQFPGNLVTYQADGSAGTPTIAAGASSAFTVDAAGKIYETDPATNSITTFDSLGLPSTPTITQGLNKPSGIAIH